MLGLQIMQLDHVTVLITDIERSRRYYRDLLGLKEIAKPRTFDFKVLWFDLGNQHLHLLVKDKPDAISPRHFALRLKDVQAARTYFASRGIAIDETTTIPGADRFFIHDPDGNRIEMVQWLSPYDPTASGDHACLAAASFCCAASESGPMMLNRWLSCPTFWP
jgi:glyoxylase I family protein